MSEWKLLSEYKGPGAGETVWVYDVDGRVYLGKRLSNHDPDLWEDETGKLILFVIAYQLLSKPKAPQPKDQGVSDFSNEYSKLMGVYKNV